MSFKGTAVLSFVVAVLTCAAERFVNLPFPPAHSMGTVERLACEKCARECTPDGKRRE